MIPSDEPGKKALDDEWNGYIALHCILDGVENRNVQKFRAKGAQEKWNSDLALAKAVYITERHSTQFLKDNG